MYQLLILSQRIVLLSGAWAFLSLTLLALLDSLSFNYFLVLCLVGFIILVMFFGPSISRPQWRTRAGAAALIGIVIFGLMIAEKYLAMLNIRFF